MVFSVALTAVAWLVILAAAGVSMPTLLAVVLAISAYAAYVLVMAATL
jgi:hypothetical protein